MLYEWEYPGGFDNYRLDPFQQDYLQLPPEVQSYFADGYRELNDKLRRNRLDLLTPDERATLSGLRKQMRVMGEENRQVLFRGMGDRKDEVIDDFVKTLKPGVELELTTPTSASTEYQVSRDFARNRIGVSKKPGQYNTLFELHPDSDVRALMDNAAEQEFTLDMGQKIIVEEVLEDVVATAPEGHLEDHYRFERYVIGRIVRE